MNQISDILFVNDSEDVYETTYDFGDNMEDYRVTSNLLGKDIMW